jgi:hypothetical protein
MLQGAAGDDRLTTDASKICVVRDEEWFAMPVLKHDTKAAHLLRILCRREQLRLAILGTMFVLLKNLLEHEFLSHLPCTEEVC